MQTTRLYEDDTFALIEKATVVAVRQPDGEVSILLDRTVFYPQGGGQPADKGRMRIRDVVVDVRRLEFAEDCLWHIVPAPVAVEEGDRVGLEVDGDLRRLHARLHTAGHLVANVTERLFPGLIAVKGFHYPEGPYVEFVVADPNVPTGESAVSEITDAMAEATAAGLAVRAFSAAPGELESAGVAVPEAWRSEPYVRVVSIGEFKPIPCGGTHMRTLSDVGVVRATKCKSRKDRVRVSYQVDEI